MLDGLPALASRLLRLALLGGLLAACETTTSAPEPRARASLSAADPGLIEVRIGEDDGLVRQVWLRGPAGESASGLRVPNGRRPQESGAGRGRPSFSLGATGGSSSGVRPYFGVGLPIFTRGDPPRRGEALYLIPIPTAFATPRAADGWVVEVRYRDAARRARSLTIPAPP